MAEINTSFTNTMRDPITWVNWVGHTIEKKYEKEHGEKFTKSEVNNERILGLFQESVKEDYSLDSNLFFEDFYGYIYFGPDYNLYLPDKQLEDNYFQIDENLPNSLFEWIKYKLITIFCGEVGQAKYIMKKIYQLHKSDLPIEVKRTFEFLLNIQDKEDVEMRPLKVKKPLDLPSPRVERSSAQMPKPQNVEMKAFV